MNREQMIEKAARALYAAYRETNPGLLAWETEPDYFKAERFYPNAHTVVDAILPQVTTVVEEFTIAWDGELSMSGQPHRMSMGSFRSAEQAQHAIEHAPAFDPRFGKVNVRVERRRVTEWERVQP